MKYWLMKSEADVYSIDQLKADRRTMWDGVRNYQARNNMKEMAKGDMVLYYHSRQTPSAVVGLAKVVKEAYPDPTQFDPKHKYFDARSDEENPRWELVDVQFVAKFDDPVSLHDIKAEKGLSEMVLVNNSRLSVQPVRRKEFEKVLRMAGVDPKKYLG
jgi:predicted RNA-binding protein with PUA-like domain